MSCKIHHLFHRLRLVASPKPVLLFIFAFALVHTGCRHMMRTHRKYSGSAKNSASVSRVVVAYPNLPRAIDGERFHVSGERPYFEVFELLPGSHTMEVAFLYRPLRGKPLAGPPNDLEFSTRAGMMYLIKEMHWGKDVHHFVTDPIPMRLTIPNTSRTIYLDTSPGRDPDDTGDHLSFFVEEGGKTTVYPAFNSKNGILPSYSKDRKHVAFTRNKDDDIFEWIVDGVPERHTFERLLTSLRFSNDGSRYAYAAQDRNQNYIVVDGTKKRATFDDFISFRFSPDNEHIVITAMHDNYVYILIDDETFGPYAEATLPSYGESKGPLSYFARKIGSWRLYYDGRVVDFNFDSPAYPFVVFSPDESAYYCLLKRQGKVAVYTNGRLQKGYESVSFPVYSPNSHHLAYMGTTNDGDKNIIVLDGREVGLFEEVEPDSIGFDADSTQLFFKKKVKGAWQMAVEPLSKRDVQTEQSLPKTETIETVSPDASPPETDSSDASPPETDSSDASPPETDSPDASPPETVLPENEKES